jgi:hypothetical protein
VDMPARPLGEPISDELGLVGSGVVEDEMNIEAVGNIGLDGVEELRNSCARWRRKQRPMILPTWTSSAANKDSVPCRL